jgi:kumamolisin
VPDVSANAVRYDCYAGGAPFAFGGTSGAAALWAALMGLVNEELGRSAGLISPLIYQHPRACCRDVAKGSNSDTEAVGGWDACTGWGSPNGTGLLDTLRTHGPTRAPSGSTRSGAGIPARETLLTDGKRTTPIRRARPR